jgi:hypothetical protein
MPDIHSERGDGGGIRGRCASKTDMIRRFFELPYSCRSTHTALSLVECSIPPDLKPLLMLPDGVPLINTSPVARLM